ncbi:MAG: histidinol-phosphate transaminase [Acidimicrobiales bacterium]
MSIGRIRPAVTGLPPYRPGKAAEQAEAEHGIRDAVKLASNENPYQPIPEVVQAMQDAATGVNRYADHRATALRGAIGEWIGVSEHQVAIGCGSVGLLQQLFLTYVDAGDQVVSPWRSFEAYPIFTQLMGAEFVEVPLVAHRFDLEAVADAVTPATKLVLLATPNNPTGTAVSTAELHALVTALPADVMVVVDEAYREFLDPAFGDPVRDLVPEFANVVVTRTLSKAFGLAGARTGYLVGHPDVVTEVDKTLVPFAVNAVAQAGALAAVCNAGAYEPAIERLVSERTRVVAALTGAGWTLPDSQANFVYLDLGERTLDVCVELERHGVVTRPFADEGLRVTIGTPEENDKFLRALGDVGSNG